MGVSRSKIRIGQHVRVNVRGVTFTATVRSLPKGYVGIEPEDPKRYTWRFVSARMVKRKLEAA